MSWNEKTKTLSIGGYSAELLGANIEKSGAVNVGTRPGSTHVSVMASELTDFCRAVLAAAGEPVDATPAPFKSDAAFEDVQVGDRVRASWDSHGISETKEGVVFRIADVDGMKKAFALDERDYETYLCGLHVSGSTDGRTIDILSRPEPPAPVYPRTIPASDAHEHVGSRVTVEKGGTTLAGRMTQARAGGSGNWLIVIECGGHDGREDLHMVWLSSAHPITLEAPADAGASVVGGA